MSDQWSDDHTLAMVGDDGVTVNGALIPWATLSAFGRIGDTTKSLVEWLIATSALRLPDGNKPEPGDIMELFVGLGEMVDGLPSDTPPEIGEGMNSAFDAATAAMTDMAVKAEFDDQ